MQDIRSSDPKALVRALFAPIAEDMAAVDAIIRKELDSDVPRMREIGEHIVSAGGKRMRPALLMLICRALGYEGELHRYLGATIELLHTATLMHDDVVDESAVRRGKPSVYARWGGNVAILSGDAMLISAYRLLAQAPPALLPRILEVFNTMALGVCEGQQYDMDFESKQKVSVVEYMSMIELKTSVLVAGSAMMGAILGGADEEQSRRLYQFAIELGMAFQLQDDLLDSYGGEELGKTIGGDILEGKKSYLMVTAMSRADEEQREVLRHTYKDAALAPAEKIARVRAVFDALDVPRLTEQQISLRFDRALATLDGLNVPDARKEPLREYARSLMGRRK